MIPSAYNKTTPRVNNRSQEVENLEVLALTTSGVITVCPAVMLREETNEKETLPLESVVTLFLQMNFWPSFSEGLEKKWTRTMFGGWSSGVGVPNEPAGLLD